MHRLTASILDVSNAFHNNNVPIHEIVCVSQTPYYIDWFEISYPNVPLNQDDGPFFFQCMNVIQGTKPAERQWNILLDVVVTIIKYKKSIMYHDIYIKVFTDGTVSYLTVSTDDVLNTTNNGTEFPEPTRFFKEHFDMKVQEGSVLKCLIFCTCQSPLDFSVDQTDYIMEIVNELFQTGIFLKVDTPFLKDSAREKELLSVLPLTVNSLHKSEMEYHGKFGHTLGRIQHIDIMSRIDLCYANFRLYNQTVGPTLPDFQGIKSWVQYLTSHS